MTLKIVGINELIDMELSMYDHIFSLVDDERTGELIKKEIDSRYNKKHVLLYLDDVEDPKAKDAPARKQIEFLIHMFSQIDFSNENTLIHCHGGISRSTAAGIIFMMTCNAKLSIEDAFDCIMSIRPQAWPNELILYYADEILGLNGLLCKYAVDWKEKNLGVFWEAPPVRIKNWNKSE